MKDGFSETRRRQDVHVARFELVGPCHLLLAIYAGNLHLGRSFEGGGVLGQPSGLSLHHLHGSRLLSTFIGLQRKASCETRGKEEKNGQKINK